MGPIYEVMSMNTGDATGLYLTLAFIGQMCCCHFKSLSYVHISVHSIYISVPIYISIVLTYQAHVFISILHSICLVVYYCMILRAIGTVNNGQHYYGDQKPEIFHWQLSMYVLYIHSIYVHDCLHLHRPICILLSLVQYLSSPVVHIYSVSAYILFGYQLCTTAWFYSSQKCTC